MRIPKVLGNETRLHILKELEGKTLTYTDLMKNLGMDVESDRGKFTYHLNVLKDSGLVKQEDDMYRITEQGEAALVSGEEKPEIAVHKSLKPLLGGILLMLNGYFGVLFFLGIPASTITVAIVNGSIASSSATHSMPYIFGIILLLPGILNMASGFAAISRRFWKVAMIGGIAGVINFTLPPGTILALVGTILIGVSRKEFELR
jgi:DNA-binding transcriptional ArsR family regulator